MASQRLQLTITTVSMAAAHHMSKLKGAMLHVVIIAIVLLSKEKDERDIITFT